MKTLILTAIASAFLSVTWLATANAVMLARSAPATPYLLSATDIATDADTEAVGDSGATLHKVALHGHSVGFKKSFRHHRRFNRHGVRRFRFHGRSFRHRKFKRHHNFHDRFRGHRINRGFRHGI